MRRRRRRTRASHSSNSSLIGASLKADISSPSGPDQLALLAGRLPADLLIEPLLQIADLLIRPALRRIEHAGGHIALGEIGQLRAWRRMIVLIVTMICSTGPKP
jgi:hypothetical protein